MPSKGADEAFAARRKGKPGRHHQKRGVVEIIVNNANGTASGCTGALIHSFYMITAAHCVAGALPGKKEGDIRGFLKYFKTSGTNPILLHDTAAPTYAQILPSYQGSGDMMSDFALVSSWRFGAGWPHVTKARDNLGQLSSLRGRVDAGERTHEKAAPFDAGWVS